MTKFRKKPVVITAITFGQLVAHGLTQTKAVANNLPWAFEYGGHPITHESDDCYLIPTLEGAMKIGRDDMLITGVKGEIYPCKRDIFAATYDAVQAAPEPNPSAQADQHIESELQAAGLNAPRITPADIEANIASEHFFSAYDGAVGAKVEEMHQTNERILDTSDIPASLELATFCVLVLRNGTKVVGINYGAIDPAQHSAERGRQEARAQAVDKVYELLGFRLRDELARPVLTEADAAADLAGTPRPDNHSA